MSRPVRGRAGGGHGNRSLGWEPLERDDVSFSTKEGGVRRDKADVFGRRVFGHELPREALRRRGQVFIMKTGVKRWTVRKRSCSGSLFVC
ncbi:unnamed protein product [Calypogeia fissa]